MRKSVTRAINEAIDDRERLASMPAPPVDGMGVVTAGTTITTDIPDLSDLDRPELVAMPDVPRPDEREIPVPPEPGEPEEPTDAEPEEPEDEEPEDLEEALKDPQWRGEFKKRERYSDEPEDIEAYGGMSKPGKMPCITLSMLAGGYIDPDTAERLERKFREKGFDPELLKVRGMCPQGTKLAQIPGSVCYGCYAFGGNYLRPNVINALARRAKRTREALADPKMTERWVKAIASAIERSGTRWFRWHDSGDILGPAHLEAIVEVARMKPGVKFWLPTKEHDTARRWLATYGHGELPKNLNIRLSAHMLFERIHAEPPLTSSSVANGEPFRCPATYYDTWAQRYTIGSGKKAAVTCGPCRACWDRKTRNVDYAYHGPQWRYRHGLMVHGLLEPKERPGKFTAPSKSRLWTPAPKAIAKARELPKRPGPVTKITRSD